MVILLEDLIARVPGPLKPIAEKYGPALVKMTADEFAGWLEMLALGRSAQAWEAILERLDNAGLLGAWEAVKGDWDEANRRNAARLKLQREAIVAVLRVLLAAALAAVGL